MNPRFLMKRKFSLCLLASLIASRAVFADFLYVGRGLSVIVFDTITNQTIGTIPLSGTVNSVYAMAASPDYTQIYVGGDFHDTTGFFKVIDAVKMQEISSITLSSLASAISPNPHTSKVYVSQDGGNMAVVNTADFTVQTITTSSPMTGIAVTPDGQEVYQAKFGSPNSLVYVVDTATSSVTGTVTIGSLARSAAAAEGGIGEYVYVNQGDTVAAINTDDLSVATITCPGLAFGALAATPDNASVYVVGQVNSNLYVIDTDTNTVASAISLTPSANAMMIAMSPDAPHAYISSLNNDLIYVVDTNANTQIGTLTGVIGFHGVKPLAAIPSPPIPQVATAGTSGNNYIVGGYLNVILAKAPYSSFSSQLYAPLSSLSSTGLSQALETIDPVRNTDATFASQNLAFTFNQLLSSRSTSYRLRPTLPTPDHSDLTASLEGVSLPTGALVAQIGPLGMSRPLVENKKTEQQKTNAKPFDVWVLGFGQFSHQNAQDQSPAFSMNTGGFLTGFDYGNPDTGLIGTSIGYAHLDLNQAQDFGRSKIQAIYTSLYSSLFADEFFFEFALGGGYQWIEGQRHVFFSGFDAQAQNSHHALQIAPHFGMGYDIWIGRGTIEPFLSLDWAFNAEEGYTESGAAPYNMQVPHRTSSMLRTEAGLNGCYSNSYGWGSFLFRSKASYVNKSPRKTGTMNASIVGSPQGGFTVEAFTENQNLFSPSVEFFFLSKRGGYLSILYDGEFGSGYRSNEVLGKLGIYF